MKKVLISLLTIAVVGALITGGVVAYFSDTETSTGNVFTAGTIDISLDPTGGQDVTTVEGYVDLKPCQTGYIYACVNNDGTNPADIWKHIANVDNREHGITDAEAKFYADNPNSVDWLISNWIHYDLFAFRSLGYSWYGEVETDAAGPISVAVEDGDCTVTWTIDFPGDDNLGNGTLMAGLIIALDGEGEGPAYQIHNNDGTCSAYEWGTWLYSPYDNGWHSGDPDWNTPVADMDWISASGERYNDENDGNVLTISISKCRLVEDFHWALLVQMGTGWFGFTTQAVTIPDIDPYWAIWTEPIFEYADIADLVVEITEDEEFMLSGTNGVACNWIYLGVLEPGETMCVIQSYHLDIDVGNWGQSDRVFFDMEFIAQQTEGDPQPPPPSPELPGYERPS